jgi:secondary thiamine-phosphate synthase enzyme
MRSVNNTVLVETHQKLQLFDVTSSIRQAIDEAGVQSGFVGVYSQHTTASVFVTECQAALTEDVAEFFRGVVKDGLPYKHNSPEFSDCDRQNAASHLRALLLGQSVLVPVVAGKPVLGQFQSVMLAEFDGPRQRSLHIQVLGE